MQPVSPVAIGLPRDEANVTAGAYPERTGPSHGQEDRSSAEKARPVTSPALMDFYIGYRGFRTLGFFGTAGDRIVAIDTDLSRDEWNKGFAKSAPPAGTANCPGGMTSAVTPTAESLS